MIILRSLQCLTLLRSSTLIDFVFFFPYSLRALIPRALSRTPTRPTVLTIVHSDGTSIHSLHTSENWGRVFRLISLWAASLSPFIVEASILEPIVPTSWSHSCLPPVVFGQNIRMCFGVRTASWHCTLVCALGPVGGLGILVGQSSLF